MVNLAIGDNIKMKASNIEFKLPQPSYTINTLTYLKEKYPLNEFALIMGEDNLDSFHKWKNYEEILKHYQLYVYPRQKPLPDGPSGDDLRVKPNQHQVKLVNAPLMEISSTAIRQAIKEKKDMRYFTSEPVWEYIKAMHFYEK